MKWFRGIIAKIAIIILSEYFSLLNNKLQYDQPFRIRLPFPLSDAFSLASVTMS